MKKNKIFYTSSAAAIISAALCLPLSAQASEADEAKLYAASAEESAAEHEEDTEEVSLVSYLQQAYGIQDYSDVTTVLDNCSNPDDAAVTLYLSKISRTEAVEINMMRRSGSHWQEIIASLDLDKKDILPQFQALQFPEKDSAQYISVRMFRNWILNPKKYQLYDKTLRQLCAADLLTRTKNADTAKAVLITSGDNSLKKAVEYINSH